MLNVSVTFDVLVLRHSDFDLNFSGEQNFIKFRKPSSILGFG